MADDQETQQAPAASQIEFVENHIPGLESGDYRVTAKSILKTRDGVTGDAAIDATFTSPLRYFTVMGDRFALKPDDVHAVFPPAASLGEHSNVLPHIVLTHSTLPWERHAIAQPSATVPEVERPTYPWLALLLFDDGELPDVVSRQELAQALNLTGDEATERWQQLLEKGWLDPLVDETKQPVDGMALVAPLSKRQPLDDPSQVKLIEQAVNGSRAPKVVKLSQLGSGTADAISWHPLEPEAPAQHPDDLVRVIDVPHQLLLKILPAADELRHLAHVRQGAAEGKPVGDALAVIICKRLPKAGGSSTVHLVSVENLYDGSGFCQPAGAGEGSYIRLVSLHSWQFACIDEKQSFQGLLTHLNHRLLFSVKLGDDTQPDTLPADVCTQLNGQRVPAALAAAFVATDKRLQQATAGDGAQWTVTDTSVWQVVERYRRYWIGKQRQVYSAAGVPLFALDAATFKSLATGVAAQPLLDAFQQQGYGLSGAQIKEVTDPAWWLGHGANRYVVRRQGERLFAYAEDLDAPHTLHLPCTGKVADKVLRLGYVPTRHYMRGGDKSISWYRGPLVPFVPNVAEQADLFARLPAPAADGLLRYDAATGLFDVSYAAAWELGRLLALKSKQFSLRLYNWKRHHAQQLRRAEQQELHPHLAFQHPLSDLSLPPVIEQWLSQASRLVGLPFNYLVPDERLLPQESIRFFYLDPLWMACLIDGAFSIGRVTQTDRQQDRVRTAGLVDAAAPQVSGFLLRSAVVAGWPTLQVDAYDYAIHDQSKDEWAIDERYHLPRLRMDRLSPHVLLCLFAGDARVVDIHEKPETIHFGLDRAVSAEGNVNFRKALRDGDGNEVDDPQISPVGVETTAKRVVNISALFNEISAKKQDLGFQKSFTAAQFALQMIEGVQKVRFVRQMEK